MSCKIVGKAHIILAPIAFSGRPELGRGGSDDFVLPEHLRQFTFECVRHCEDRSHLRRRAALRKGGQQPERRCRDLLFTFEMGCEGAFQLASGSCYLATFCRRAASVS